MVGFWIYFKKYVMRWAHKPDVNCEEIQKNQDHSKSLGLSNWKDEV